MKTALKHWIRIALALGIFKIRIVGVLLVARANVMESFDLVNNFNALLRVPLEKIQIFWYFVYTIKHKIGQVRDFPEKSIIDSQKS